MIAIKRILCPVDLSEQSGRALRHAGALARWYGAELATLSVRPTIMPAPAWAEYPAALPLGPDPDRTADAVQTFVRETLGLPAPDILVKTGNVVQEILRTAETLPADLVVMGTHGLGGFERFLLGSVTEKVLRKCPCPVLTVPPHISSDIDDAGIPVAFKTVLCAIDFSRASRRALNYALSLAQENNARLLLVHVLEWFVEEEAARAAQFNVAEYRRIRERETRAELGALLPGDAGDWCQPEIVIGYGRPHQEVLRIAAEQHADLFVLGVQGRNPVDLAIFGSTTQHLVRQATCPVLTVRQINLGAEELRS